MFLGLFLIILGILIAIYPQLLIGMISGLLIMSGLAIFMISLKFRRMRNQASGGFMNWMFRI
jgi:hypothetical protein